MNGIDLIILVIIGFFCVKGLFRGLIIEVFTLLGLVVGYVIALREVGTAAGWFEKMFHLPDIVSSTLGFLLIFVLISLLFRLIAGIIRRFMRWTFIGWLDRGSGFLFGLFKGALVTSLLLLLFSLLPLSPEMRHMEDQSFLFKPVRSVAPAVFNFLKHAFPRTKDFYEEVKDGFSEKSDKMIDQIKAKGMESVQKEVEKRVKEN